MVEAAWYGPAYSDLHGTPLKRIHQGSCLIADFEFGIKCDQVIAPLIIRFVFIRMLCFRFSSSVPHSIGMLIDTVSEPTSCCKAVSEREHANSNLHQHVHYDQFHRELRTGLHNGTAQPRSWDLLKRPITFLSMTIHLAVVAVLTVDTALLGRLGLPVYYKVLSHFLVITIWATHLWLYEVFKRPLVVVLLFSHVRNCSYSYPVHRSVIHRKHSSSYAALWH